MTLRTTPAQLGALLLVYLLVLIGACSLVAYLVLQSPQPPEGRPLRTHPPAAEPQTTAAQTSSKLV